MAGFVFADLCNNIIHYYSHGSLDKLLFFLLPARWYHIYHHKREFNKGYGFCTPFWDVVFNTLLDKFNDLPPICQKIVYIPIPIPYFHWILLYYYGRYDWNYEHLLKSKKQF